jgi:tetratricopeptide (TPR) repeat protein
MARLDRLDSAKRVAQLGAVIGRQFEYTLLRAVWEQDETRLQQELDLLVKVELVYQQGIALQATYVFKHVLIQEAAYQSLLRRTRRRYHQRIAQTLHTRFPDTAARQPVLLAHHYTAAGLAPEAVPYWQNAGWKALRSSAHQEAVAHFRKGLEVLSDLPETPERNRLELDLLIALGPALMATEGFSAPDLIQTYSRAHELCQHMEATPQYTQALMGLWQFYVIRSELNKAQELAAQLHRLAHQLQALALLPTAYRTLGKTAVWQGDFSSARTFLEQGAAVYDPRLHRDHAWRYGLDPGVVCLGSLAWSLWHLGYPDQARQKQHEALGLARELSHPFSLAFALCVAAICFEWCGDLAAVRAYGDEAVALATEQRFPFWMAIGMAVSGFASVCLGQATEGIVQLRQGYDLYRSTGAKAARLWFLNILTRAALQMNNLDEANAMSNAALVFMETTEERFSEVESYWLQGKLRLAQATSAHELQTWAPDIDACLVRAQRAARRRQMKSLELRIAISLRELWQSQGRSDEAQRLLAEVYKTFTEGWDTADLQQAKALLAASP